MQKIIKLNNVRINFESLFDKESFNGQSTGKYSITVLIAKDNPCLDGLKSSLNNLIKESNLPEKALNKLKNDKSLICLKDCDEMESPYEFCIGHYSLKSTTKRKPIVLSDDNEPIDGNNSSLYSGCYVDILVNFWLQNNAFGTRINSNLFGVRFNRDGEPLDGSPSIDSVLNLFGDNNTVKSNKLNKSKDLF